MKLSKEGVTKSNASNKLKLNFNYSILWKQNFEKHRCNKFINCLQCNQRVLKMISMNFILQNFTYFQKRNFSFFLVSN